MTLTIDLTPEEEIRLKREAARLHLEPTEYVRKLINLTVDPIRESIGNQIETDLISATEDLSPEEWNRRFIVWVEGHNDWPQLPPESYNKEILYEDRF